MPKIVTVLFLFVSIHSFSQSTPFWIGSNLSELYFFEDTLCFHQKPTNSNLIEIRESGYFYMNDNGISTQIKMPFVSLDPTLDTIFLKHKFHIDLFIKPEFIQPNNFKFLSFQYEIVGDWNGDSKKYSIYAGGHFRVSTDANRTVSS